MFDRGVPTCAPEAGPTVQPEQHAFLSVSALRMTVAGKTLLDIPSLRIQAGGPTVVIGPNGAGKSLLLRALHGLSIPSQGCVLMHGEPLDARLCRRQAMVFQSPVILRRSVRANVEFALASYGLSRAMRKERAMDLLSRAGLRDKARQPARSLSGGEQQKLAVIRALATDPEVLFLDEPTSKLDPASVQSIEMLIQQAARGGTKIVLVSHDLGQVHRLGHEVVFLHQGRITEQTPIEAFSKAPASKEATAYLSGELLV